MNSTNLQRMPAKPFRTHYDNLQVARTASDTVIRAAYKSLAQKYHPDRATGDVQEAERTMQVINLSYGILSNPDSRREHDQWIAGMEEKNRIQVLPMQVAHPQNSPVAVFADASSTNRLNIGIKAQYESPRLETTLLRRMFGWLFVVFMAASVIPFIAQLIYWFRFKTWIALPARLAFGHGANLPSSISVVMPDKSVLPTFAEWLYHPVSMPGIHQAIYAVLDSLNVSLFYLASTILIFYVIQFFKERVTR